MSTGKIEFLDFAKGYAIFSIVLFHILQVADLSPLLQKMIFFGGTGVHLFFLLSGYGLGLSKGAVEPISFYQRRASKIWLPYALILTISMAFAYATNVFPDRWQAWLSGIGLYQMFMNEYVASYGGHFWFISAIIQFYLVYPFVKKWVDARGGHTATVVLTALSISVAWWLFVFYAGKTEYRVWNSFFLQFLWEFVLGLALASALRAGQKLNLGVVRLKPDFWNTSPWAALIVGGLFSGVMLFMALKLGAFGKICNDVPALLGYTGICVFMYQLGERWLPFVKQFFLWIGSFSFSLYLVHMLGFRLFILGLAQANIKLSLPLLLLYIPMALVLGRLFEPISQAWTNRLSAILFHQNGKLA
jgi:peptidoglycan/LPS O-acetylase OafA/YrhL